MLKGKPGQLYVISTSRIRAETIWHKHPGGLVSCSNILPLNGNLYIINSRSQVKVEVNLYLRFSQSVYLDVDPLYQLKTKYFPLLSAMTLTVLSSRGVCSEERLGLYLSSLSLCLYLFKWVGNLSVVTILLKV